MDDFFLDIYINEIKDQIQSAEIAYSILSAEPTDINVHFKNIYYFALHVSRIVKIIQPNAKENEFKKYRMIQIKTKYPNLPEIESELIVIRDHFEHLDERIDNWVINSKKHNYIDKNMGDAGAIVGFDPNDQFRFYDPKNKTLYFLKDIYPLDRLYDYIQKVKQVINN